MITVMELRPYQENIVNGIRDILSKENKVLVSSPTGSGKTKISQWIIERLISNKKKCLFTVPRIKLAIQTQESFGFGNLILGNKTTDNNSLCTIASVQSLYSRKIKEPFDFIFIDECHFAHGSKYLDYIFKTYKKSKIIGLSATPIDENGYLLSGYNSIVNEVSVKDLIKQKYLVDVDVYTSKNQPDLKNIEIVNGDYNQNQASNVLRVDEVLSNTMDEWERLASNLKTLVFATDIKHSEELRKEFISRGYKADAVHSKMTESDIEQSYKRFNAKEISILINVDMATFGFDEPSTECLLFARPVKSLRLYKQMVGRGLRIFEGKSKCLIIDCANVVCDNGYPTDAINYIKKPVINKTVDSVLKIERNIDGSIDKEKTSKERIEYLEKVGSLLDLYAEKKYLKEQDLLNDCKKILKRAGFYFWRQNSGKAYMEGRWVHFTDKNGLPDITLIYHSVYIGLELKLPKGRLTKHQKETLPFFVENKTMFFIVENVIDLFECMESIRLNILSTPEGVFIKKNLFELSKKQAEYRVKYKFI